MRATTALPHTMTEADVRLALADSEAANDAGAPVIAHDPAGGPMNRPMRLMLDTLATSESSAVATIVDQIEENPTLFAVRYLNLESFVHQLATKVETYAKVATDRLNGQGTEPSIEAMRHQLTSLNTLAEAKETRRRRDEWLEENREGQR